MLALARSERGKPDAHALMIASVAELMGLSPDSEIAVMIAKRILRKAPAGLRHKPAPNARASAVIVAATLAIGALVGWVLASPAAQRFVSSLFVR